MTNYPSQLSLRKYIQTLPNQEQAECCTSCATLLAAEIAMAVSGRKVTFSRLYLYYMTRKLQGRIGQHGAQLKYTLDAFSKYGVCTENKWPFNHSKINIEPGKFVIEDALNYKVQSYESIPPEQFKDYLNNDIPIIVGMFTGRRFWSLRGPFEEQGYRPVNSLDNPLAKGHAVTIIGYDDNLCGGSWIAANSLGPKWGFQGYAAIPYTCNTDIGESYVITSFSGITVGEKIS